MLFSAYRMGPKPKPKTPNIPKSLNPKGVCRLSGFCMVLRRKGLSMLDSLSF